MSSVTLLPVAEHIYNILLLNEKEDTSSMTDSKIKILKTLANNIHSLIRMLAGPSIRCDQVSIPYLFQTLDGISVEKASVFIHGDHENNSGVVVTAIQRVETGTLSINQVLLQQVSATFSTRLYPTPLHTQ